MENKKFNSVEWNSKGLTTYNSGDYVEPIECNENSFDLDPHFKEAWFFMLNFDIKDLNIFER